MNDLAHTVHSHVMGGSIAAQRRNCPGSLEQEKDIPDGPSSEFADRGLMLHAAMELLLTENPNDIDVAEPLLVQLIGQDMGFKGHEITQELVDTKLRPALQSWMDLCKKYDIVDYIIEQRVSLEGVIPGAYGTADVIARDAQGRFHSLDWKFGDGIYVPVEANDGSAFYTAATLYDDDPELIDFCKGVTGILFHIVQPRVGFDDVLHTWETSEKWLETWIDQSIAAIKLAKGKNPPLKPGDWCRFCKAKPTCPAFNALAGDALSKKPESMDAVSLADALHKADLLKMWIKSIYELAQQELEGGAAVPGFKLVNKLPRRQWEDEAKAEKRMRRGRVLVNDLFKRTLISPTQLEKLKPKLYSKIEDDFVILHSSGLTVVPDSDKRAAVTGSMELLTNALPEAETNSEQQPKRKRKTA